MEWLSKVVVQKGHVFDVEPSNSSDLEENDPTYECEEVDYENDTALVLVEATSSGKKLQIVHEELALKFEAGATEKRMYQKAFIIRMSTSSISSAVVQLNEAQAETVRSMQFASFLKVNIKLLDGQKFPVIAFDVCVTLGVPFGGREIMEITKSSTDEEYDENGKLSRMPYNSLECQSSFWPKKTGGESFKRNFIIYLVNCFINGPKNRYYSKSILKYVKEGSQIASLDYSRRYKKSKAAKEDKESSNDGAPSFRPTLTLQKLDSEDQFLGTTSVAAPALLLKRKTTPNDVIKKYDSIPSCSLVLGLNQLDSKIPIPQTTSTPDPNTTKVNEDDVNDDEGALLRFPLKDTSQLNCELSIKKPDWNRPKEGDKPLPKRAVEHKKGSPRADGEQPGTDSTKLKLTKEVLPGQDDEKRPAAT
ncbi:LOW QUALITY PROTEIN: hypothetical protein Cgig2_025251 [Carnegiea gigantea]|uniref:Uncharacterized protein n=1 Tax=Carnegiea gigantea TaxID=171969 RepID=A0A9Q1JJN9_9CARY|nr:LOW QUALITY PROTEIN: hypothetical protein Cgig2_025251 [Carnegiea gigantea]